METSFSFVSFPHQLASSWGAHQDSGAHQPERVSEGVEQEGEEEEEEEEQGEEVEVDRFEGGGVG